MADEVVAALKNMGSRSAVEGGLAGLFVAAHVAAFDCYRLARLAGFDTPIGEVMLRRADKMTCRATELADALSRYRSRGQQRIVIQHIHGGGQAVGMVNQGE